MYYLGTTASAGKGWKAQALATNPSTSPRTSENRSGDPFANYAAYDFRLTAESTPGDLTGCPAGNSQDMFSATRGADGVVTRGALEFGTTAPQSPPQAPTNLRLLP